MELGNKRGKFTLKLWIARIFYQLKARAVKHLECLFQKTKKKKLLQLEDRYTENGRLFEY